MRGADSRSADDATGADGGAFGAKIDPHMDLQCALD